MIHKGFRPYINDSNHITSIQKQGCPLSQLLFNLFIETLAQANKDETVLEGISIFLKITACRVSWGLLGLGVTQPMRLCGKTSSMDIQYLYSQYWAGPAELMKHYSFKINRLFFIEIWYDWHMICTSSQHHKTVSTLQTMERAGHHHLSE